MGNVDNVECWVVCQVRLCFRLVRALDSAAGRGRQSRDEAILHVFQKKIAVWD